MKPTRVLLASLALALFGGRTALADDSHATFVAPADAGLVDVTKAPYDAVPDDGRDDTAAIQQALDDHANGNQIIYLPDGEYLITDTLRWPDGDRGGLEQKRLVLQGQSTAGTILKLRDRARGFTDPDQPKAMVWTGQKPAQRFRNGVWTLTLDTGRANPGAIGLQYIANNQGSVRHVHIRSGDAGGRGVIGLDLGYTDEQGPCLIKHVTVEGFDVGVSLKGVVNSVTFEHLTLRGQREVGIRNGGQVISVRGLDSVLSVPAIEILDINALVTLIDSRLKGAGRASREAAIVNQGALLIRDTRVDGYRLAVENKTDQGTAENEPGGEVALFVSHLPYTLEGQVSQSEARTLRLEVRETPDLAQPPAEHWAGPHQFGGDPTDDRDDSRAVQKAIDSGARVVYFPNAGRDNPGWRIDDTVLVRGDVERVTALEGRLTGKGGFKVVAGEPSTVSIDRMDLLYQGVSIENASDRTLVLSGVTRGRGDFSITGRGDLFIEDVVGGEWVFPDIRVWARQFNVENDGLKVHNKGGRLWCLGLKTEKAGTVLKTSGDGQSEVLGGFIYSQGKPKTTPMFVVDPDAALVASVGETTWNRRNFGTILETPGRGALERTDDTYWRNNHASMLPLLMALPPAAEQ